MERKKPLPVGLEFFTDYREDSFYYVDKTGLIVELMDESGGRGVHLITRPRRFGKTLMMTTLKSFFEVGSDPGLFDGLAIAQRPDLCERYQAKYPVIFMTLRGAGGPTLEDAISQLSWIIFNEASRFKFLRKDPDLDSEDLKLYESFFARNENGDIMLSKDTIGRSLSLLSALLYRHYGRKVIILVDEYDVPLDAAYRGGYYDEMVGIIREMFGSAFKSNPCIQMGVLTGCLRIAKESIFTGINNLKVYTVADKTLAACFGFTDEEVRKMLDYYEMSDRYDTFKEWYDGYRIGGKVGVYCPWDVMCYMSDLRSNETAKPQKYWSNTSGNYILKELMDGVTPDTRGQVEALVAGESITQRLRMEMTYADLYETKGDKCQMYMWTMLYVTGYLTDAGEPDEDVHTLRVPNGEIRRLLQTEVMDWIHSRMDRDTTGQINAALDAHDDKLLEQVIAGFLGSTMSIRDTLARNGMKENFYQGVLLALVNNGGVWAAKSQREGGNGYPDLIGWRGTGREGFVMELKYAEDEDWEGALAEAARQIDTKAYKSYFEDVNVSIETVTAYAVAFYKKTCKVRKVE